jgi:glyceraldehyde-3-phosphate dehydrogenase (NADP+)
MESFRIYAGGAFATTPHDLIVSGPFDGKPFARTFKAGMEEYEKSVNAALDAAKLLRKMPSFGRSRILREIYEKIMAREEVFAGIIAREAAKPWRYALAEVSRAAQTFFVAPEEARRMPGDYLSLHHCCPDR